MDKEDSMQEQTGNISIKREILRRYYFARDDFLKNYSRNEEHL